jgi:hypothetical protein
MFIRDALIICKRQKTDEELKAILASHPWAPSMTHGFYRSFGGTWEEYGDRGYPDAIWIDQGIAAFDPENKWIVENFHTPELCQLLPADPFGSYGRRKNELEERWWHAIQELIAFQIPDDHYVYNILYGELEDESGEGAEQAWRESLLEHFNYSPEVEAVTNPQNAA